MKKFTFFISIVISLTSLCTYAQAPEKIKYQAVARDNGGNVLSNQPISFRISILQSTSTGTSVYSETHLFTTNDFGLANLTIGNGTIISGNFSSIDWSSDLYFLQVEMDETGGTTYQLIGTSQLLSVPYALHSQTADSITNIDQFSWSTTGNSGINPSNNFIGTIDNQPLIFKVNNQKAGELYGLNSFYGIYTGYSNSTGSKNTAIGYHASRQNSTGDNNTAIGYQALYANTQSNNTAIGYKTLNFNTTGINNTAVGFEALRKNTVGFENVAIGYRTLSMHENGYGNTAIGFEAMEENTSGTNNTAIGRWALKRNTADFNTAIGRSALGYNTSGDYNTAVGLDALYENVSGHSNTAIGVKALENNQHGDYNTAVGIDALQYNTGSNNTAIGRNASLLNNIGYENTSVGVEALRNTTTAGRNVGVGYQAGYNNSTGFYNTALGYKAGPATDNIKNSTALGREAFTTAWNQVRIGNNIVTSIGGYTTWSNISDKRFKKEIRDDIVGLDFIMALEPVSYQLDMDKLDQSNGNNKHASDSSYKETEEERQFNLQSKIEKGQMRQSGFLAQDVEQVALSVGYDFSGVDKPKNENDYYGLRYAEFVVPLVKAVQEQQELIKALIEENQQMKDDLAQIKSMLNNSLQN